jgi:nicotinamide-nucleotide amidase
MTDLPRPAGDAPVVEVVSTGTELMLGRSIDGNFATIAAALQDLPLRVRHHSTYGDDFTDLCNGLKLALARADVVLWTGGLGPTADDLTRDVAAKVFHRPLVFDPKIWKYIRSLFRRVHRKPSAIQKQQAFRPKGSRTLINPVGSAPGFHVTVGGQHFFALPGVPFEMEAMLHARVIPTLTQTFGSGKGPSVLTFKLYGLPESTVEEKAYPFIRRIQGVVYGITVARGIVTIRLRLQSTSQREHLRKKISSFLQRTFGEHFFADREVDLPTLVAESLLKSRRTLASAESCTGGFITDRMTDIPGASQWLRESVVCYSNESKLLRLGVSPETIRRQGAVSARCALEMAKGIAQTSGADYGISSTGIAGPTGAQPGKPVGLVYTAVWGRGRGRVEERRFHAPRQGIKERAADQALNLLRLTLAKEK